jgi:transcriptional regulator with XRE-family HTH domain
MSFADTLQELRKAAGLSQVELAQRSDTAIDTLRKWEQGRNLPNIEAAARLAKAMGVSLDRLAGDGEQTPPAPKNSPGRSRKGK